MNPTTKKLALAALGVALVGLTVSQIRGVEMARANAAPPAEPAPLVSDRITAEGRVVTYPGAEVIVGTDLAGTLVHVAVEEKQTVRRGQLLAELRADDLEAAILEAQAQVSETEADLRLYETEVARAERLFAEGVVARQAVDRGMRDRDATLARQATARAAVRRLEAQRAKARILAPIDGVVTVKRVHTGETVDVGEELLTLANLSRVRIEAEVDEFDTGHIRLGQAVQVSAEGFEGQTWQGTVEEIPDTVAGRRLKPQDPGRPQDTRVLLVKVALTEPTPLKLGQRVEVEIAR